MNKIPENRTTVHMYQAILGVRYNVHNHGETKCV